MFPSKMNKMNWLDVNDPVAYLDILIYKHKHFGSMTVSVLSLSVCCFGPDWNISTNVVWIPMNFGTNNYGVQRTNLRGFSNPLNFSCNATSRSKFHLSCEICQCPGNQHHKEPVMIISHALWLRKLRNSCISWRKLRMLNSQAKFSSTFTEEQ